MALATLFGENAECTLRARNIYTSVGDLGPRIRGMVYECSQGHYHVIAADWLDPIQRRAVFWHEVGHILRDFPQGSRMIGLDRQWAERQVREEMQPCEERSSA